MIHTDTAQQPVDRHAARIHDLIAGCCVASEPIGDLQQVRADLLALSEMTDDGEAVDAACGAVAEIDGALAVRAAAVPQRRLTGASRGAHVVCGNPVVGGMEAVLLYER